MPFDRINYVMLLGAVGLIVLGYTVMLVDNAVSDNPVDSALSLYLAPLLLLGGYLGVAVAVLWGVPRETSEAADSPPSVVAPLVGLVLMLVASGCGDKQGGVEISEADPSAIAVAAGAATDSSASDTTWAETADTTSAQDGGVEETFAQPADFQRFWPSFRAALESGNRGPLASLTALGESGISVQDFDSMFLPAVRDETTKRAIVALETSQFERSGTQRRATATMGFDADGNPVPEDEAETESSVILTFDVVNGAYRLVRFDIAG